MTDATPLFFVSLLYTSNAGGKYRVYDILYVYSYDIVDQTVGEVSFLAPLRLVRVSAF